MDASKAFGIAFNVESDRFAKFLQTASGEQHRLLPVPAVFIVGTDGQVKFQYVNPDYETRIDPQTVLAAARAVANQ